MCTHEQFVQGVRQIACSSPALSAEERQLCLNAKLVYGRGADTGLRGVTQFQAWSREEEVLPIAEICALGESDFVQLAGTTIHELGHVLAGMRAGHGPKWREACAKLGLRFCRAAGTVYTYAVFDQKTRWALDEHPKPTDGLPQGASLLPWTYAGIRPATVPRPCTMGVGTRGGKSRGTGSGSRLRKFTCACKPPVIVRASRDCLNATCNECGYMFKREEN